MYVYKRQPIPITEFANQKNLAIAEISAHFQVRPTETF